MLYVIVLFYIYIYMLRAPSVGGPPPPGTALSPEPFRHIKDFPF